MFGYGKNRLFGAFARHDDQAVDSLVAGDGYQVFQFLRVFVRTAEQHCVLIFIGAVLDTACNVGEEFVGDVRYDHAYRVRLSVSQGSCGVVRLVIEPGGDIEDALRRLFVHTVGFLAVHLVIHHERYEGRGDSRFGGYILDCNSA